MRHPARRRQARELFRLPGLLLFLVAACSPGPPAALRLLREPGRDGRPVALDQVLILEFDGPLNAPLRPGAVALLPEGDRPRPVAWEVSGRQLRLYPELPRRPDLSDGTLKPGRRHRLLLRGVPHLAAITSLDGRALVGDRLVEFRTLAADAPEALGGNGGQPPALAVPGLAMAEGGLPVLEAGADGRIRIPLSGPVDPRSLVDAPAWLLLPGGRREPVALEVLENRRQAAVLGARLPGPAVPGVLVLPEDLRGPGGVPLDPASRELRVRRR